MSVEPFFKLTVVSEYLRGTSFCLTQEIHACGRARNNCDVSVNHPSVSSQHCNFSRRENSYCVVDMGSTNGTRVNNVPIGEEEVVLRDGDIVAAGVVEMLYQTNEKFTRKYSVTGRTGIDLSKYDPTDTLITQTMDMSGMGSLDPFHRADGNPLLTRRVTQLVISSLVVLIVALTAYLVFSVHSRSPVYQPSSPSSAVHR